MNTLEPATIEEARLAIAQEKRAIMFVGGGTKLALGAPPTRLDTTIKTTKLARVVEYAPSDQVVTVEAGITLAALQARLAEDRQRLSLDPPWPEKSTIGGIIATNAFGPLRTRMGSVRDLILGVSLVRADGVLAKGGGKVVKNVAGFDLPKLACGSLGTLALIAAVTLRVHPLPEANETRLVRGLEASDVVSFTRALREAQLEPSAVLAVHASGAWDVALRFEGFGPAVTQQVARLGKIRPSVVDDTLFATHQRAREDAAIRLKVAALPTALPAVERAVAPAGGTLAWYPLLGVGFVSLTSAESSENASLASAVKATRREIRALGGRLVVETAPFPIAAFDDPPAIAIHRAIKARFDPDNLLAPGRFVGGI